MKYPIGIQTFSEIIRNGYIYIDKTDLMWELSRYGKYIFLGRPRRFGKSLLTSTLAAYFKGEKELFQGLKIMNHEKEWEKYPVIHLDISTAKAQQNPEELQKTLMWILRPLAEIYGRMEDETTPGKLLQGIIQRAAETVVGGQAVVLIDEYDAPLLDVIHEDVNLPSFRKVMQEFYMPLKANEAKLKFCFITGITKFTQLSIFSTINNLTNVTMDPRFSNICGITESELLSQMSEDIEMLASEYGVSYEDMCYRLKLRYDGYHFSKNSEDIYNPYSLLKAFRHRELNNYWFESGTPTFLINQMQHFRTDITSLEKIEVPSSSFDQPTENMKDALPLLYQSGYLTIKGYDPFGEIYNLSIPNQEVRIGFTRGLLPIYSGLNNAEVQTNFALKFWKALKSDDIELGLHEMKSYLASLPYIEGFKKKLQEAATAEGFYEYTMYLIFSMLNVYVRTQVKCAGGRIDMIVSLADTIYVFEFKTTGTAQKALQQIEDKGYAIPYETNNQRVVKIGVKIDVQTRTIEDWAIEK